MKVISQSKSLKAKVFAATVLAQVEANEHDATWQATLAAMPKGVMFK